MIATIVVAVATLSLAVWIAAPIAKGADAPDRYNDDDRERLGAAKLDAYRSIMDLELDRKLGKVDTQDYLAIRGELEREAAAALTELDALNGSPVRPNRPEVRDQLEEEIAQMRRQLRKG